jgi:hypothetical protein
LSADDRELRILPKDGVSGGSSVCCHSMVKAENLNRIVINVPCHMMDDTDN